MPTKSLIHSEKDITAGTLKVNDAFDIRLYELSSGDYELEVFMKVQFIFEGSALYKWAGAEKSLFVKNWERDIKKAWGSKKIKTLGSGKHVTLNFDLDTQIGGWMFDHWEVTVTKIKAGSFRTSYVAYKKGQVALDSEDLVPISKGAKTPQRGAVHEFGHMLGLDDEYISGNKHRHDTPSIMHSSEVIRPRHNSTLMKWLNNAITLKRIK
jgi:hypothetical protein